MTPPPSSSGSGSSFSNLVLAVDQHIQGVTGDQHSAWTRAANTPNAMLGVGQQWATAVGQAHDAWHNINAPAPPNGDPPTAGQKTARVIRAVQQTAGVIMGGLGAVKQALDVGFANLTAPLAAITPSLPAATVMSPYLGTPHAHPTHPPSGPPPIPPTPLPSIGAVMLGVSTRVLINSMPAARVEDIGLAPTCCGLPPAWFKIKTGSSNVFIGGNRAARLGDICKACPVIPDPPSIAAGKVMAAIGKAAGVAASVLAVAGVAVGALGMAADIAESAVEDNDAMAAGKAMAAATAAAQMAMDAAKMAVEKLMWKDVPVLPPTGSIGGIIDPSHATVLIGGFPMINIPDPVSALLHRLSRYKAAGPPANEGCGKEGEPIDVVTGANLEDAIDFPLRADLGLPWRRYYESSRRNERGPLGWGWRHEFQAELQCNIDGLLYVPCTSRAVLFPPLVGDGLSTSRDGLTLWRIDWATYELRRPGAATLEFRVPPGSSTGRLTRAFTASDEVRFAYDDQSRLVWIDPATRPPLQIEYDAHGLLVRLTEWRSAESSAWVVAYEYDANEDLVAWTDALGHQATLAYDDRHQLVRKGDRRGYSYYYAYDAEGRCVHTSGEDGLYNVRLTYLDGVRCTQATHADGGVWTYFYDEHGTITRIVDPYGTPRERVVGRSGQVDVERDAAGNEYRILHDAAGGVVGRRDPFGHVQRNLTDLRRHNHLALTSPATPLEWEHGALLYGRDIQPSPLTGTAEGRGPPPTTYDALGRKLMESLAGGAVRRWTYDGNGNVLQYEDGDRAAHRCEYASWNLLYREADPLGNTTEYGYTARERITRVADPGGTTSEYVYDQRDNIVQVVRHGRVREQYVRDATDNLIEKRDGAGRTLLSFEIGPGNLPLVRRLASGESHQFSYDTSARLTRAATDLYDTHFEYGAGRRPIADVRDGLGVRHGGEGPRRTCVVLDRFETIYARGGRTLTVTDPTGAQHRIAARRDGTITLELSNGATETRRYDAAGRCLSKSRSRRDVPRPWVREYFYSAEGDLLAAHDSMAGRSQYDYDAAHRLIGETRPRQTRRPYAYDAAGNLTAKPGLAGVVVASGNRLAAANGETFAYDDRDHLAFRAHGDRTTQYEYDSCDRLTRCVTPDGEWIATYDPLGRRVSKCWRGAITQYYWDDNRLAAERGADGAVRVYVYLDAGALVPFMFVDYASNAAPTASGRRYFVVSNQIGTPIQVEDEQGWTVWRAEVDPYGGATVHPDSRIDFALRFPGHYEDREVGLCYNRFRYYSPALGRYLQSDPLGVAGGLNLYAYPANPLTVVDLFGLHSPKGEGDEGAPSTGPDEEEPPTPRPLTPEEEAAALLLVSITRAVAQSMVDNNDPGRGPVLTGVIDPRFPEDGPFFGQNTGLPENLSAPLQDNLDQHLADVAAGRTAPSPTAGTAGDHSEVNALDQALKNRQDRTGQPPTQDDLNDMIAHNVNLKNQKTANDDGTRTSVPAGTGCPPRCDNCRPISGGTRMVDQNGQLTDAGDD